MQEGIQTWREQLTDQNERGNIVAIPHVTANGFRLVRSHFLKIETPWSLCVSDYRHILNNPFVLN